MSIRFDTTACMTAFRAHVIATLLLIQEEYMKLAESHMLTPEGREDLTSEEIVVLGDFIMANVSGGAWAVMDEMGTGSLLSQDNPALESYMQSDMWNPYRGKHGASDTAIRSRPPGGVDIFGNPVKGSPNPGVNLEALGKVQPQPPSHAMQTAARWMMNGRIQTIWREAMEAFPWGNYIVVTPG